MRIKCTFAEPALGSLSGNREVTAEYIASKADTPEKMAEEVEAVPDIEETLQKATTVFARTPDGKPQIWDYQVRGFFKAAALALSESGQYTKEHLKKFKLTPYTYKRTIDTQVFVFPRKIPLILPEDGAVGFVERPLRAETMRGPRIALARSESVPAGTTFDIEVEWLNDKLGDWVKSWLDYGRYSGIGQWRNGSYGRFTWEEGDNTVKAGRCAAV
ncbi:MAG: hypothetical protein KOO60_07255 [Gemmatimonadales bacterium]|nr:hypothetical protein [Gemmatimonadales bacterium]